MDDHDRAKKQRAIDLALECRSLNRIDATHLLPDDMKWREYHFQRLKDTWTELKSILEEYPWILDDEEYKRIYHSQKPVTDPAGT
jgi:hypothetical protein